MGMGIASGMAAGGGADALEQILKQAFLEQIERRRAKQDDTRIQQDQQRIDLEGKRQAGADADRDELRASTGKMRDIQNATRISGMLRPGQNVGGDTVGALKAGDLGDLVQHDAADLPSTAISGMATAGTKAPMMGQLRMMAAGRPARDTFTGTAEQLSDEQARGDRVAQFAQTAQDRKDAAAAALQARTDAAAAAQTGREDLARLTAGLRGGNADLQRELLQGKIDAAQEKTTEKKQAVDAARNAAVASIDDTAGALDELIDEKDQLKPGVGGAVGLGAIRARIPGTSAADAKARIDRLQSRLVVDLLGEMKRQSRTGATGFGALTEKELAVIQNAAARLGNSQSDESFRLALIDVRKQLAGMRQRAAGAATSAPPGTPGGFRVVEIK